MNSPLAPSVLNQNSDWGQWQASLALELQHGARGTRLVGNRHQGPLYVQKPFYPEGADLAHVYLLHPPGGLVSGDHLQVSVNLGENAQTLLTTPGAGRVYRARPDRAWQYQTNHFTVADNASLEWLPLETIIYPNARTSLSTRIDLQGRARFVGWEVTSLGLPTCGRTLEDGEVQQRFAVYADNQPLFIERLQLDEHTRRLYQARVGMQASPINGLFVAGRFASPELLKDIKAWAQSINQSLLDEKHFLAGVSVVGDCLVGRYLGQDSEQARGLFEQWWQFLRPYLLQRPACAPRIWLT